MKRLGLVLIILLICSLSWGMGGKEQKPLKNLPLPDKLFQVTLIDQEDVSVELTQFSLEGHTMITGKLGDGKIHIPFEKIKTIQFKMEGKELWANLSLMDQGQTKILVENPGQAYGKMNYGNYQIHLKNVKKVQFHPQTRPK
jgi:hypothetical protein